MYDNQVHCFDFLVKNIYNQSFDSNRQTTFFFSPKKTMCFFSSGLSLYTMCTHIYKCLCVCVCVCVRQVHKIEARKEGRKKVRKKV